MTMNQLHPSEFATYLSYQLRSHLLMWGSTLLAGSLLLGALAIDEHEQKHFHWLRTGLIMGAAGAVAIGRFAHENTVTSARIAVDHDDISAAGRQQRLYHLTQPQAESALMVSVPAPPFSPDPIDWAALATEARKHPHLMLLGATGSGKTSLVEALMRLVDGQRVVVHPHYQQSDIPGHRSDFNFADKIVGGGRNFPEIEAYMNDLYQEFDRRSKLTKSQMAKLSLINVLIDELPAIAKNCSDAVIEQIISLLLESRKYGIRLLLLAQSDSVRTLNIEGQGDAVREQVTYVRLGRYAVDHCKSLISKKRLEETALEWLEQWDYPCMVEDAPGRIPTIVNGQFVDFNLFPNPKTDNHQSGGGDDGGGNGGGRGGVLVGSPTAPPTRWGHPPSAPPPSHLDSTTPPVGGGEGPFDPFSTEISPDEWAMVVSLKRGGVNQAAIIKKVWGVNKSGTDPAYAAARTKYMEIINKTGLG